MSIRARLLLAAASTLILTVCGIGWSAAAPPRWPWPLSPTPTLVARFEAPPSEFGPGHRGIDLAASAGQLVTSATEGTVTVAGPVAGRGVVVVRRGSLRLTYEPVTAAVRVGEAVTAGSVLGRVAAGGSHCAPATCLHVGLRRGDEYLDPLPWFGPRPVRLKPLEPDPDAAGVPAARDDTGAGSFPGHAAPSDASDPDRHGSRSRLVAGGATVLGGAAVAAAVASRRRGQARG